MSYNMKHYESPGQFTIRLHRPMPYWNSAANRFSTSAGVALIYRSIFVCLLTKAFKAGTTILLTSCRSRSRRMGSCLDNPYCLDMPSSSSNRLKKFVNPSLTACLSLPTTLPNLVDEPEVAESLRSSARPCHESRYFCLASRKARLSSSSPASPMMSLAVEEDDKMRLFRM